MRLYGSAGPLTAVSPGDRITLFDGTEAPAALVTSLEFVRAPGPTQVPAGIVFTIDFAAAPTDSLLIQGANVDLEADYQTLFTSTNTQHDYYHDAGNFLYYRAKLNTYAAGGMPVVIAQR